MSGDAFVTWAKKTGDGNFAVRAKSHKTRAEADAWADEYKAQGFDVILREVPQPKSVKA